MKKILLAGLLTVAAAGGAMAQDQEDIRVYINPGHGSWTGNDRPCQVIGKPEYSSTNTDTTGFFESNTDLIKGLGMLEKLIDMGVPLDRTRNQEGQRWEIGAAKDLEQQIVMSRVKNGPFEETNTTSSPNYMQYNRSLPEIAAEVEYNEFDIFVSIHSNAATEGSTTNYHLFMYRGKNGIQNVAVSGSWEMAESAAKYSFLPNKHAAWSTTSLYINGDVDFMGGGKGTTSALGYYGYLGVLKHGCPGYLVEGYFHTYQPARHRGMNWDVDRIEGASYARGIADYFGFETDSTGDIYGIVRDAHTKFTHALYKPNTRTEDVYLPLNGVKAILYKDGEAIQEYTTDNFYNGAFVFYKLEPGTYTVAFEHPDYLPIDPVEVEVKAGETSYPSFQIENKDWQNLVDMTVDYPDPLADTQYTLPSTFELKNVYTDKPITQLQGKTIRRVLYRDNVAYILAIDAEKLPTLLAIDPKECKVLAEISTKGTKGSVMKLSDIQMTADGVLLASACSKLHYSSNYLEEGETARGTLNFYRWNVDEKTGLPRDTPKVVFTTQSPAMWYRAYCGETFSFTGTLNDGCLTYSAETTGESGQVRAESYGFIDGQAGAGKVNKLGSNYPLKADLGEDYRFITSPLNTQNFYVMGSGDHEMLEFSTDHVDNAAPLSKMDRNALNTKTVGVSFIKYAGQTLMVAPEVVDNTTTGIKLLNITKGVQAPETVNATNTAVDVLEHAGSHGAASWVDITRSETTNEIMDVNFHVLLARNGALSFFSTDSALSGVESVASDAIADDVEAEYYNLRGIRVTPDTPGVYIRVRNGVADKVVIR